MRPSGQGGRLGLNLVVRAWLTTTDAGRDRLGTFASPSAPTSAATVAPGTQGDDRGRLLVQVFRHGG
jgi:hypothetical protein